MLLYFNGPRNAFKHDPSLSSLVALNPDEPICFSYGSNSTPRLLLDTVQFGDGYEQRALAGIRPTEDNIRLLFDKKSLAVAAALRLFFLGSKANTIYNRDVSEPFWIKLPAPFNPDDSWTSGRKYVLTSFSLTPVSWDAVNVEVGIKEWFGL